MPMRRPRITHADEAHCAVDLDPSSGDYIYHLILKCGNKVRVYHLPLPIFRHMLGDGANCLVESGEFKS